MSARPILRWIGSSAADAIGRMLLQFGATVLFARWLVPEVFGQAALTAVAVGMLSVFVTAPFEEALTQRKTIQREHFSAALAAVLLAALGLCSLGLVSAVLLPEDWTLPRDALPAALVYSLILFADGPISIFTAACRRHRRFTDIAWTNLLGQVFGTAAGIAMVILGAGVWGLLAVRFFSRFVTLGLLLSIARVRILPQFSRPHLAALSRFAGWHLAGRCVESVAEAAYQFLVTAFYGLAATGYLNLAMRIVEPLRGAVGAIGHNIAMSYLSRTQDNPSRFREAVVSLVAETALLLLPVFIGLAVIAPTVIAVLAGPAWADAAPLAVFLALAAAVGTITNFMHSALSAQGRADLGFAAGALDLMVMSLSLVVLSGYGLIAAGFARFIPYVVDAVFVIAAGQMVFGLPAARMLRKLSGIVFGVALMAAAVAAPALAPALSRSPPLLLATQVVTGCLVYAALVWITQRSLIETIRTKLSI